MINLEKIKTIVILMFENRSFDHMLGHLSLEYDRPDIDGFKPPLKQHDNIYNGDAYSLYYLDGDSNLPFDLPHEWNFVDIQLGKSGVTQKFTMKGFVEAYAKATNVNPNPQTEPMGYFDSKEVPITSFLGRTFCICNRWFASLPTSTQPNRTIAFSGDSGIFETHNGLMSIGDNIFDWLDRSKVNWRVYHDGLSFFALYPSLWKYVLSDNFRDYENLYNDIKNEADDTFPQVIIVEPSYYSGPHIGPDHPNDNHAPLAIGWGEDFLRRTYESVISNTDRWGETVMIVYSDEHGGFYDHVPPPPIKYSTTGNPSHQFESLGIRIPGIIISPFVSENSVCNSIFDHTSVLQFLAEKFTPGVAYSNSVDIRKSQGIVSLSDTLTNENVWFPPTSPSGPINVSSALGDTIHVAPSDPIAQSFEEAARQLIEQNPGAMQQKYPDIIQWKDTVDKSRS